MNTKEFYNYLNEYIHKSSKLEVVSLYSQAIRWMQAYNGRTEFGCLALALGFEVDRDDNGNEIYSKGE